MRRHWISLLFLVHLALPLGACAAVGGRLQYITETNEKPEVYFFVGSRTDVAFIIGDGPSSSLFARAFGLVDFPASLCVDVACLPIEALVWLFIRPRDGAAQLDDAADDAAHRS